MWIQHRCPKIPLLCIINPCQLPCVLLGFNVVLRNISIIILGWIFVPFCEDIKWTLLGNFLERPLSHFYLAQSTFSMWWNRICLNQHCWLFCMVVEIECKTHDTRWKNMVLNVLTETRCFKFKLWCPTIPWLINNSHTTEYWEFLTGLEVLFVHSPMTSHWADGQVKLYYIELNSCIVFSNCVCVFFFPMTSHLVDGHGKFCCILHWYGFANDKCSLL